MLLGVASMITPISAILAFRYLSTTEHAFETKPFERFTLFNAELLLNTVTGLMFLIGGIGLWCFYAWARKWLLLAAGVSVAQVLYHALSYLFAEALAFDGAHFGMLIFILLLYEVFFSLKFSSKVSNRFRSAH